MRRRMSALKSPRARLPGPALTVASVAPGVWVVRDANAQRVCGTFGDYEHAVEHARWLIGGR